MNRVLQLIWATLNESGYRVCNEIEYSAFDARADDGEPRERRLEAWCGGTLVVRYQIAEGISLEERDPSDAIPVEPVAVIFEQEELHHCVCAFFDGLAQTPTENDVGRILKHLCSGGAISKADAEDAISEIEDDDDRQLMRLYIAGRQPTTS